MVNYELNGTKPLPVGNGSRAHGAEVIGEGNYATFGGGNLIQSKNGDTHIIIDGEYHNLSALARGYNGFIRLRVEDESDEHTNF